MVVTTINRVTLIKTSVFFAELFAIFMCLLKISESPEPKSTIFSDSLSSIQAIKDIYRNNPLVARIHTLLVRLHGRGQSVTLCWVPSHVGVEGNERADKIANEAANNPQTPRMHKNFFRDLFPLTKKIIQSKWEDDWENASAIRPNKLRRIKESVKMWPSSAIPRMRLLERSLCRLRICHCHLTHSFLMEGGTPPDCEFCDVPFTVKHILTECYEYAQQRRRKYGSNTADFKLVLSEEHPEFSLNKLERFLLGTNLLGKI